MRQYIILILLIVLQVSVSAETCSRKDYEMVKSYDNALWKDSEISEDLIRKKFAKKYKMKEDELREMYFRCLRKLTEESAATQKSNKKNER